ncbi:MAG: hypothetical protein JSV04_13920 [Candidatus Heimdallarchaeota archaeon]|nr:MAG: hypothetical protein JSV04_13920 [Candidatus Heimdallarchaeota archaeon]
MKICGMCGSENPIYSIFCTYCGNRFSPETVSDDRNVIDTPSPSYRQPSLQTSIYGQPQPLIHTQPVREQYGHIVNKAEYQNFINGNLALAIGPIISFGVGIFFFAEDNVFLSLLGLIIDFISYALFIYGIYSIRQLEPRSLNDQLKDVPTYMAIFAVLSLIAGILFEFTPSITTSSSIEEVRSMVIQGLIVTLILAVSAIALLIGANSFTKWFEEVVAMLGAPYNAHTNLIRWLAICLLIGTSLLTLSYLLLLIALTTSSESTVDLAMIAVELGTLILLAAVVLQITGGFKIYSVLKNIRIGKYDGTYYQHIMRKYQ